MEDILKETVQRAEIGWDRDKARNTLAEAMSTIEVAARLARKAVTEMENTTEDITPYVSDFKEFIETLRAEGKVISARSSGMLTRSQAQQLITICSRLQKALDVGEVVRMSLDLTNQSRMFIDMMNRIDARYGEEDRKRAEDMTEHLTDEQLSIVLGWIQENKLAKSP